MTEWLYWAVVGLVLPLVVLGMALSAVAIVSAHRASQRPEGDGDR